MKRLTALGVANSAMSLGLEQQLAIIAEKISGDTKGNQLWNRTSNQREY